MIEVSATGAYSEKFSIERVKWPDHPGIGQLFQINLDLGEVEFVDMMFLQDIKRAIDIAYKAAEEEE